MFVSPVSQALLLDQDASDANAVRATSADGKLSEAGPATQNSTTDESVEDTLRDTWEDYTHSNDATDPVYNTIRIENPNTRADVSAVNVTASYVENDSALLDDGDPGATAETLQITTFTYDGTDELSEILDTNGNGYTDVDDLAEQNVTLHGVVANGSATLTVEIAGDSALSSSIGGDDGIDFTLHVGLMIDPSWREEDASVDNTIQYGSS